MKKTILLILPLLLFYTATGFPFSFEPLSADFSSQGAGTIQTFRIENDGDEAIAVKISIQTREMDYNGAETNRDASHLFQVYPPQVYLEPGLYQAVRVQWTGPGVIGNEQSYRIIAEQLPVRSEAAGNSGGSINIMLRYKGAIYVLPENPLPKIDFFYAEPVSSGTGGRLLSMEIANRGNSHTILQDLTVTVNSAGGGGVTSTAVLEGEALKGMIGENILAGQIRRFLLPWPEGLDEGDLSADLSFRPVR